MKNKKIVILFAVLLSGCAYEDDTSSSSILSSETSTKKSSSSSSITTSSSSTKSSSTTASTASSTKSSTTSSTTISTTSSTKSSTTTSIFAKDNLINMTASANLQCDKSSGDTSSAYGKLMCTNSSIKASDDARKGSWFNNYGGWWVEYDFNDYNVEIYTPAEIYYSGDANWEVQLNFPLTLSANASYTLSYDLESVAGQNGEVKITTPKLDILVHNSYIDSPDERGATAMLLSNLPNANNSISTSYSHTFNAPYSNTYICFMLGGRGEMWYNFTNIRLIKN